MGEWEALKMDSGTGWKELHREAGTGWKALLWDSVAIDVGDPCINRSSSRTGSYTRILKGNPANATGTLTNICLFVQNDSASNVFVGTFHNDSGTLFTCKSVVEVGALVDGVNNKAVSLAIAEGDYIGVYGGSTDWEADTSGGDGYWYNNGNEVVLDEQNDFTLASGYLISVYGTG